MLFTTNEVKVPLFIPQGASGLVMATVWYQTITEHDGIKKILHRSVDVLVNLAVVASLAPVTLRDMTMKRDYDCPNGEWTNADKSGKFRYIEIVSETGPCLEVFEVSKIHSDLHFPAYWISFPKSEVGSL